MCRRLALYIFIILAIGWIDSLPLCWAGRGYEPLEDRINYRKGTINYSKGMPNERFHLYKVKRGFVEEMQSFFEESVHFSFPTTVSPYINLSVSPFTLWISQRYKWLFNNEAESQKK